MDITDSTPASIIINDTYKLHMVENVESYEFVDYNTHRIKISNKNGQVPVTQHYFVIELLHHDVFGHWVYESAVYLPIFKVLKEHYPTIKILLKGAKRYKTLFLNFFKITDVCYELEAGNVCLFPSPITSTNDIKICPQYLKIIENFMHEFQIETGTPIYEYVVLPRQTIENYKPNDRTYNMESIYASLVGKNYKIYNTDECNDLAHQIMAVRSAPIVIVTEGSAMDVNLMFGKNQCFHIIGNKTRYQKYTFPKSNYISTLACSLNNNTIHYLD